MLPKQRPPQAPAAPDGETDLPVELQIELLHLRGRGGGATHYEMLGLDATADGQAIRSAYLDRSKRWHPDAHYQRKLGSFAPLLSEAFGKVSEAHAVLADAEQRADYDAGIEARVSARERDAIALRRAEKAENERRAEERRRRLFHTKGFARLGAARRLYEEAQEHAGKGERGLAVEALKVARELDPSRKEIQARLLELERELQKVRVAAAVAQARALDQDELADPAAAMKAWLGALRADPNSLAAHLGAARAALRVRDFASATSYAARAVEYAPRAGEGRLLHARALAGQGQKAKAKAILQALLEDQPDNKEARAVLKAL